MPGTFLAETMIHEGMTREGMIHEGMIHEDKTHNALATQQQLSDTAFLQQFEAATLPPVFFDHLGHLRAAFLFLERESVILAQRHFAAAVDRYATALGKPEKFHTTVTFALLAVIAARQGVQRFPNWQAFISGNPDVVTNARELLLNYYHAATLDSERARQQFVLPDKASLASLMAAS